MRMPNLSTGSMAAVVVLAGTIGCGSLGDSADELLTNPSFHVLLNDEQAVPASGTFDFDTKLFKINYDEQIDLAAVDARVIDAIEAELEDKGFKRDAANPDVLVSYAVAMDASISGADFNEAYADDFPIEVPDPNPDQELHYHQGALIVDFVDSSSRKLLWRGAIMADVSMEVSEKEKDQRVRQGVRILLGHFPRPIQ